MITRERLNEMILDILIEYHHGSFAHALDEGSKSTKLNLDYDQTEDILIWAGCSFRACYNGVEKYVDTSFDCKHPPAQLFTWYASGDDGTPRSVLVVGCRKCGVILQGAA